LTKQFKIRATKENNEPDERKLKKRLFEHDVRDEENQVEFIVNVIQNDKMIKLFSYN